MQRAKDRLTGAAFGMIDAPEVLASLSCKGTLYATPRTRYPCTLTVQRVPTDDEDTAAYRLLASVRLPRSYPDAKALATLTQVAATLATALDDSRPSPHTPAAVRATDLFHDAASLEGIIEGTIDGPIDALTARRLLRQLAIRPYTVGVAPSYY